MARKKTTEQFISQVLKVHSNKYDYSKVIYKGSDVKICVICPLHGEFWPTAHNHLGGSGCPQCVGRTVTKERFIEKAIAVHGNKYDYSKVEYINPSTLVKIICPTHGEFMIKPTSHLAGNGCSECSGNIRLTTERFIRKAREVHGDIYDYSKTDCVGNNKTKVCVICPDHGEFWVTPNNHLKGSRCPRCYGTPKYTTAQYIEKATKVHSGKYDYSLIRYKGNKEKIEIICPEHGIFWQHAGAHLRGSQCPACSNVQKVTPEIFISRATNLHEGKYDYSLVDFSSTSDFIDIICPIHGVFSQKVSIHLRGYGCQYCGGSKRLTNDEFIEKANAVHHDKYNYSKSEYINTSTKVCIICPDHGEFWQIPNNHLLGTGCPKCAGKYNDLEFFIERAKKVHGDKYDYSKAEYTASAEKVCIICPTHGEFWQTPSGHMHGQGCPMCNQSHLERDVMNFLKAHEIRFEVQKTFEWLYSVRSMHLDFFLPDYGVAIECQGGQHFKSVDFYGGDAALQYTIERDTIKKQQCEKHGIRVLYYSDLGIEYPYYVIENLTILLKSIQDRGIITDTSMWADSQLSFNFDS